MVGNKVLLLTDIVDSTWLNQRLGDATMADLWASHDQAARELLRAHRGREIGRSDGFLVLFDSADDAVAFAVAYTGGWRLSRRRCKPVSVSTAAL